YCQQYNSYSPT
nr:immunoglobulin light chain junction region [Homo sapiens]